MALQFNFINQMLFIQILCQHEVLTTFRGLCCLLYASFQDFFLQMLRWHLKKWAAALFPEEFSFACGCCFCSLPGYFVCDFYQRWERYSCEIKLQRLFFYLLESKPLLYNFCTLAGAFMFEQHCLWNADYNVIAAVRGTGSCCVTVIAQGINSSKKLKLLLSVLG